MKNKLRSPIFFQLLIFNLAFVMMTLWLVPIDSANYHNEEFAALPGVYFEGLEDIRFEKENWRIVLFWDAHINKFDSTFYVEYISRYSEQCTGVARMENLCNQLKKIADNVKLSILATKLQYENLIDILKDIEEEANLAQSGKTRKTRRQKRMTPLGFVGMASRFLFGTLDKDDLKDLNSRIDEAFKTERKLAALTKDKIHLLQLDTIKLQNDVSTMRTFVESLAQELHSSNLFLQTIIRFQNTLHLIELQVSEYSKYYHKMADIITKAKYGELHPDALTDADLRKMIADIGEEHPDYEFPVLERHISAEKLSHVSNTKLAYEKDRFIIEINVPLIDQYNTQIFRIHPILVPQKENTSASILVRHEIIAIGHNKQFYTFLTESELNDCKIGRHHKICPGHAPFKSTQKNLACEYRILTELNQDSLQNCPLLLKSSQENIYVKLKSKKAWLYSVKNIAQVEIRCPEEDKFSTFNIKGTGILRLNPGCSAIENETTLRGPSYTSLQSQFKISEDYWHPKISLGGIIDDSFVKKSHLISKKRRRGSGILLRGESAEDVLTSYDQLIDEIADAEAGQQLSRGLWSIGTGFILLTLSLIVMLIFVVFKIRKCAKQRKEIFEKMLEMEIRTGPSKHDELNHKK